MVSGLHINLPLALIMIIAASNIYWFYLSLPLLFPLQFPFLFPLLLPIPLPLLEDGRLVSSWSLFMGLVFAPDEGSVPSVVPETQEALMYLHLQFRDSTNNILESIY